MEGLVLQRRISSDENNNEIRKLPHIPHDKQTIAPERSTSLWKFLCLALFLFACVTGYYFIAVHNLSLEQTSDAYQYSIINRIYLDSTSKYQQNKDQSFADGERKKLLEIPSIESEIYHNPAKEDEKNHKSMKSNNNSLPSPPPDQCHATIIILRHCEKANVENHCSYIGYERALYISTLFDDGSGMHNPRYPKPSYLYALASNQRSKKKIRNYREIETLVPTSLSINIPISTYGLHDKQLLTNLIYSQLLSGVLCNKVVMISWKHDDIPHLAHSLGCGPVNGCPSFYESSDFDTMWQIHFMYQSKNSIPDDFEADIKSTYSRGNKTERESFDTKENDEKWIQDQYNQKHPRWHILGSLHKENFDPLAFMF